MQPEFITPESLLLDTAERLGRVRAGRVALRVHLSRLSPQFRDPAYTRIAARLFDHLVATYRCRVFILSNGDIVATGKEMPFGDVDAVVYKLCTLFDRDPLVHRDPYASGDGFCTWYDLELDYDAFLAMALKTASNARPPRPQPQPPAPAEVEDITAVLTPETVKAFLTAQAGVSVATGEGARLAFQEIFVSVSELVRRVLPERDLARDRWLFQYVCGLLDPLLLVAIDDLTLFGRELPVNLNLAVETVLSPRFTEFLDRFPRVQVTVEIQPIDAFSNLARFSRACARLHESGHAAVLDGLTPLSLWMLDGADLPVDGYKLLWSEDITAARPGSERDAAATVQALDPRRVVLCRCDTVAAIDWGVRQGIGTFQGHFVDETLLGRAGAPAAAGAAS